MDRADVDRRIEACERCKAECCDCPELVREMENRLDVLYDWRASIPEQP